MIKINIYIYIYCIYTVYTAVPYIHTYVYIYIYIYIYIWFCDKQHTQYIIQIGRLNFGIAVEMKTKTLQVCIILSEHI
jgi:hypothetical protein